MLSKKTRERIKEQIALDMANGMGKQDIYQNTRAAFRHIGLETRKLAAYYSSIKRKMGNT